MRKNKSMAYNPEQCSKTTDKQILHWVLGAEYIHKGEMLSSILFIHYLEENFCLVSDYFRSHGIDRNEVIQRSVSNKGHCCFNERAFFGVPVTT